MPGPSREEVHDALEGLNDNVRLAHAVLIARFPHVGSLHGVDDRANQMRAILLDAIEVLRPPRHMPFGSLESRHYDVLSLRYVSGLTVSQIGGELSLGSRQIHRDLQEAELKLVEVLAGLPGAAPSHEAGASADELPARPAAQLGRVSLCDVARDAANLLGPLARRFAVSIDVRGGEEAIVVSGEYALLKQVLVQCLSAAIQSAAGPVTVDVTPGEPSAHVTIRYTPTAAPALERLADARTVAETQAVACTLHLPAGAGHEVTLAIRRARLLRVLVVEDNDGAVELYRRYLPPDGWELHAIADPRLTYEAAKRLNPDAIVLDIMMPKMDGWSVLALLSQHPDTKGTPVLICSVVYDMELAQALGARTCLRKPVSQAQFMAALHEFLQPGPH